MLSLFTLTKSDISRELRLLQNLLLGCNKTVHKLIVGSFSGMGKVIYLLKAKVKLFIGEMIY